MTDKKQQPKTYKAAEDYARGYTPNQARIVMRHWLSGVVWQQEQELEKLKEEREAGKLAYFKEFGTACE